MAFTKAPLTTDILPAVNAPTPENTLPEITVKPEPEDDHNIELKEAVEDLLEHGPQFIRDMSPQELENVRQGLSDAVFQGGNANTLVRVTEAMQEASEGLKDPEAKDLLDKEIVNTGAPLTAGQAVDFTKMIGSLMCRVADHQLKKETAADEATLSQVRNSPDEADAQRNVATNKALRQRLDLACP